MPFPPTPSSNPYNVNYNVTPSSGTWTTATTSDTWTAVSSSSSGQYVVAVASTGNVYVSNNFAHNFTLVPTGSFTPTLPTSPVLTWSAITCSSSGQYIVICSDNTSNQNGTVYTSENYGATWNQVSTGSSAGQLPANTSWSSITSSSNGQNLVICAEYSSSTGGYVYISQNYGTSWYQAPTGTSAGQLPANINWTSITSSSSGQYLAVCASTTGGSNGVVYISSNYGNSWSQVTPGSSGLPSTAIPWTSITSSSSGQVLALSSSSTTATNMYISTNFGGNWTGITQWTDPNTPSWNSIVSSSSGQTIAAASQYGAVWISQNYGTSDSWTQIPFTGAAPISNFISVSMSSSGQNLVTVNNAINTAYYVSLEQDIGNMFGNMIEELQTAQGNTNGNTLTTGTVALGYSSLPTLTPANIGYSLGYSSLSSYSVNLSTQSPTPTYVAASIGTISNVPVGIYMFNMTGNAICTLTSGSKQFFLYLSSDPTSIPSSFNNVYAVSVCDISVGTTLGSPANLSCVINNSTQNNTYYIIMSTSTFAGFPIEITGSYIATLTRIAKL